MHPDRLQYFGVFFHRHYGDLDEAINPSKSRWEHSRSPSNPSIWCDCSWRASTATHLIGRPRWPHLCTTKPVLDQFAVYWYLGFKSSQGRSFHRRRDHVFCRRSESTSKWLGPHREEKWPCRRALSTPRHRPEDSEYAKKTIVCAVNMSTGRSSWEAVIPRCQHMAPASFHATVPGPRRSDVDLRCVAGRVEGDSAMRCHTMHIIIVFFYYN